MTALLYSLGLNIMELMAGVIGLFNPKARAFVEGRKDAWSTLTNQLEKNTAPLLWVHCSSVGEYEQGRPVMEAFKENHPTYKILVTFYSPSGFNAVQTDNVVDFKSYLPKDSKQHAARFIELANPAVAIFIKYEFWHFYLDTLHKYDIPTFSVSSIFRPTQAFFKWYGGFFRRMLMNINYFFVQDLTSANLLEKLKLPYSISGDTRLDRVIQIRDSAHLLPDIEQFVGGGLTFVIGSLRKEDLTVVNEFIKSHPELKFIVAPHEITDELMLPLEKRFASIRYSNLSTQTGKEQVLIVNTIGLLSRIYRYANFAYIGGGFSDGIHNILEPAVYEIPVFFGNKDYQRFKEAHDLINLEAGYAIGSFKELDSIYKQLSTDDQKLNEIKNALHQYLEFNRGASKKIIKQLDIFLE